MENLNYRQQVMNVLEYKTLDDDFLQDSITVEHNLKPEELKQLYASAFSLVNNFAYKRMLLWLLNTLANDALKYGTKDNIDGFQKVAAFLVLMDREFKRLAISSQEIGAVDLNDGENQIN